MITEPTVLILGAGASKHLGFPTGEELLSEVFEITKNNSDERFNAVLQCGFEERKIKEFGEILVFSAQGSVDAFLEHRPDYVELGKILIAATLLPYEDEQKLWPRPGNWYALLFKFLNTTFEQFGKNKLSIVTFNYDRSLEHYLFMALKHAYGKSDQECYAKLAEIPIIHVHGKLGHLPWEGQDSLETVEYAPARITEGGIKISLNMEMISPARKMIKIVYEDISGDAEFKQAYNELLEAKRIYFLGFGYDERNLARLKLPKVAAQGWADSRPIFKTIVPAKKIVEGTALDISKQTKDNIDRLFGSENIAVRLHQASVYEFLHKEVSY